jgi:lipopolysaccharide/colanic/teichoic acid biosynthesis glycosyltransferase
MFFKRLFDFLASLAGILLLWPLLIIIAILIKIQMPGPVFFTQKRVGQHGKLFTMIKLRTMKVNHGGSSISVKGESRITPLGAKMRKYKLDELPGLWSVFIGDMSLVGPRPDVPGYADKLEGEDRKVLLLKPGITGPASMKYSNEEEILALQADPVKYNDEVIYPDKVRINLEYLKHQSFWLDLKIIVYTVLGKKLEEEWMDSSGV